MRTAALRQLSIFFNMAIVIFAVSVVAFFVFIQPVKAQEETPAPEAEIISAEEAAPAPVPTEEEVEQPTETLPTELVEVIQESVAVAPPPEEINEDTAVTAQDLGAASEPRVLPDSPFYIFKRWGRSVRRLVIRNPVARAEEDLRVANQKLLEARRPAATTPGFARRQWTSAPTIRSVPSGLKTCWPIEPLRCRGCSIGLKSVFRRRPWPASARTRNRRWSALAKR